MPVGLAGYVSEDGDAFTGEVLHDSVEDNDVQGADHVEQGADTQLGNTKRQRARKAPMR